MTSARAPHSAHLPDILSAARVRVPASTSNLGAGFDCIGLALDLHLEATFRPGRGGLQLERAGTLAGLTGDDVLLDAFRSALEARGVRPAGHVQVTSDIPVGRGLGSSATATVAGLVLAAAALNEPMDTATTLAAATEREGHPDNAAPTLLGGLIGVVNDGGGRPFAFRLPLSGSIAFAWAAPAVVVSTARARAALPSQVPHAVAVRALSRTAALLHGLATAEPDLIRAGFRDDLHVPYRLPLIPAAAEAMRAAEEAGAWAVTISGSGSGLFAVCAPGSEEAVARAMAGVFETSAPDPDARAGVIGRVVHPDLEGARMLAV